MESQELIQIIETEATKVYPAEIGYGVADHNYMLASLHEAFCKGALFMQQTLNKTR